MIAKPPFSVFRTGGNHLPVYCVKQSGGTLAYTLIKKVRGDVEPLRRDLGFLTKQTADLYTDGTIRIHGNHKNIVKEYLQGLGF